LQGAGRVEDTFNLLGHAARKLVETAALISDVDVSTVCRIAGIPLLLSPSIKAGLDIDWSDPEQKDEALSVLVGQVASLTEWLAKTHLLHDHEILQYLKAVVQVEAQDLETGSDGKPKLIQGVAPDRRVSIEDEHMRHGRKSKSKRFNGYKEHIATDLDTGLVVACAVTPANAPEDTGTPQLEDDLEKQGISVGELSIDRAYINSSLTEGVEAKGGDVLCKPWAVRNSQAGLFGKTDFDIDLRRGIITCPGGQTEPIELGETVEFDHEVCSGCQLRPQCTKAASGRGRSIHIAEDEARQQRLRHLQDNRKGRQRLRKRVMVEHSLAHIAARKGPRARYIGPRKNLYDLRRAAAIQNLETIQRKAA
jgi:hypothetical protein